MITLWNKSPQCLPAIIIQVLFPTSCLVGVDLFVFNVASGTAALTLVALQLCSTYWSSTVSNCTQEMDVATTLVFLLVVQSIIFQRWWKALFPVTTSIRGTVLLALMIQALKWMKTMQEQLSQQSNVPARCPSSNTHTCCLKDPLDVLPKIVAHVGSWNFPSHMRASVHNRFLCELILSLPGPLFLLELVSSGFLFESLFKLFTIIAVTAVLYSITFISCIDTLWHYAEQI